jgi:protein involved in temperature-dependent protein secretion
VLSAVLGTNKLDVLVLNQLARLRAHEDAALRQPRRRKEQAVDEQELVIAKEADRVQKRHADNDEKVGHLLRREGFGPVAQDGKDGEEPEGKAERNLDVL